MDSGAADADICNGDNLTAVVDSNEGSVKEEEEEEEENYAETKSLLPVAVNAGMAGKAQKSSRRKVQWNDHTGKKLVEVLEFQPSDSSDSEDDYADSCICAIM